MLMPTRRRAPFEALCNQLLNLRDLFIAGSVLDGIAFGRTSRGPASIAVFGSSHEDSTCADVADRSSIVDEPLACLRVIPGIDINCSTLEVKRRCHSVHRVSPIVFEVLPVRVQIDEARRDNQATRVDYGAAGYRGPG